MDWTFGGTALSGFGTVTVLEDYLALPEKRGENITVPFRHGRVHVDKFYDQRVLSFGIYIEATDRGDLENILDSLKTLAGTPGQQTLQATYNNADVRNTNAEIVNDLGLARLSPTQARVTLDFLLAEPFLRSASQETNNETIDANPKAMSVSNPGSMECRDATITLTGPLANTVITNSTNGCTLTYTGTIGAGHDVTISVTNGEYSAVDDAAANVIGNVTHSGDSALFVLDPGDNTLSIADDTHTTGTIDIDFYPAFL